MNNSVLRFLFILLFFLPFLADAQSQTSIKGSVQDEASAKALVGVNIYIKDTYVGTSTNKDGDFALNTKSPIPFTLVFSIVGYEKQELEITEAETEIAIDLKEAFLLGQEIVVAASRVEESIMRSPVSIEKLGIIDLQQSTSANFYDGLYEMKGVDMNVQSLTLRLPNTRGFNNNTNYRINQIVDGMDNTPAGLSFAAGNIFGLSQLDVESVEMLVGASSALYGPGGMNGTLVMTSKNPFDYQGFSSSVQMGMMHFGADYQDSPSPMVDFNFRYAKSFNDKFAIKITGGYLEAQDWRAIDYRDRNNLNDPNSTRENNEGYDGVNVYGDDIIVPVNLQDLAPQVAAGVAEASGLMPGTPEYDQAVDSLITLFPDQVISRTGWNEEELVDYNTRNLRLGTSLHYRFNDKLEAIVQGNYAEGTAVYTAQTRFSLKNFSIYNGRVELRSPDFYLRFWGSKDNAGETYDAGTTGVLMGEAWQGSREWYTEYVAAFTQSLLFGDPLDVSYAFARLVADNRKANGTKLIPGKPALPIPGTDEFNTLFNNTINTTIDNGGTLVIDKSGMINIEGMYNFQNHVHVVDLQVGGNYRRYNINSEGTAFFDTPGNPISVYQLGAFAQLGKDVLSEKLKFTLSARYDKHEKFAGQFTPRFSFVYSLDQSQEHNFRGSLQSAYRFPAVADQWVDLNVSAYTVIGGLPEVQAKYNFDTEPLYPLTGTNPITDEPDLSEPFIIPPFGPEEVTAFEFGYKGLYLKKRLFVDAYIFQNDFSGFLATQLLAQTPNDSTVLKYQTTISTDTEISAQGWAIGADYSTPTKYVFSGNIAWNGLQSANNPTGLLKEYNTPDYRLNLSIANREIVQNLGFKVTWRWQNSFLWESKFGVGEIPAYSTLDAQVSYKVASWKSIFKLGGSNILNQYYTTGFGNASVGGLYYITWVFDEVLN